MGNGAAKIGYAAMLEQFGPTEVVDYSVAAEQAVLLPLLRQYPETISPELVDRAFERRRGILRTALYEAPLARIQNTIVVQSLRERVCFLGTLGFATAGRGTFDAFWESVAAPFEVHRCVLEAIERYGRRRD
mgnify:CR=1 FL=1